LAWNLLYQLLTGLTFSRPRIGDDNARAEQARRRAARRWTGKAGNRIPPTIVHLDPERAQTEDQTRAA